VALLSCLWLIAGRQPLPAQSAGAGGAREFSDEQIKAALVLHFLGKTEWPSGSKPVPVTAVTVGVVAAPDFARALRALTDGGGAANLRLKVTVVELRDNSDATACQAIYFGQNDRMARGILAKVIGQPLLTIGEGREFTAAGGIFGFERYQRKIRYWFSLEAMGRSNLKISSEVTRMQLKPDSKQAEV
jgi:hypothetical protein